MSPWERGDDFPLTCPKEPSLSESTRGPLPLFPKVCCSARQPPPGVHTGAWCHWGVFCWPHTIAGSLGPPPSGVPGTQPATTPGETRSGVTPSLLPAPMGPGSLDNKGRLHPASFLGRHPFPFLQEGPERSHTNPPSRGGLRAQPGNAQALSSVSFPQQGRELRETVTTGGATAHRANPPFSLPSYQLWLWPRV